MWIAGRGVEDLTENEQKKKNDIAVSSFNSKNQMIILSWKCHEIKYWN